MTSFSRDRSAGGWRFSNRPPGNVKRSIEEQIVAISRVILQHPQNALNYGIRADLYARVGDFVASQADRDRYVSLRNIAIDDSFSKKQRVCFQVSSMLDDTPHYPVYQEVVQISPEMLSECQDHLPASFVNVAEKIIQGLLQSEWVFSC